MGWNPIKDIKKIGKKIDKEVRRALSDFDDERRRELKDLEKLAIDPLDLHNKIPEFLSGLGGGKGISTAPPTQLKSVAPATQLIEANAASRSGDLTRQETLRRLARLRRATQVSELSTPNIKRRKLGAA